MYKKIILFYAFYYEVVIEVEITIYKVEIIAIKQLGGDTNYVSSCYTAI